MSTGRHWRGGAVAAGFALALFFTGCGGGGVSGTDTVAPATLEGKSYDFSPDTGGQTAVSFNSATAYTFQHETGAIEQGTYQSQRDGNTWTVTLLNSSGGQQLYNLTFANATSGNFVLKRDGEANRFGPFSERSSAIPSGNVDTTPASTTGNGGGTTTGSTTTATSSGTTTDSTTSGAGTSTSSGTTTTAGTTSGGTTTGSTTSSTTGVSTTGSTTSGSTTTGGPSTGYTGFAPVSIVGRTMDTTRTFTSTGPSGQTHLYTFGSGTFHDSDMPEEADGTFTYSANHSTATLNLVYTGPSTFVGDKHNITMTFTAKDTGTFQSTYARGDGTEIIINGTFQFEPIP